MKVLVTGGAGFIGSNIVDELVNKNHEVVIIDNLSTGKIENINEKAVFYKEDILNKDNVLRIFLKEKPEIVIHEAAQIDIQSSIKNPSNDALINIIGTVNVLECCVKSEVKKIIYASSAAAYGDPDTIPVGLNHKIDPISFYGISKHTPEHYIKAFSQISNLKYTILRYANVYGIRQDPKGEGGVVSIFIDKYLNDKDLVVFGDGEQTRDFIFVSDVAKANVDALKAGDNGIFNVSLNKSISLNGLIDMLNVITGKKPDVIFKEERIGDIKHSRLDNTETLSSLYWKPEYSLEEGLRATYNYYLDKIKV